MAEREVDAGIEIDSGAMFRNIMDTPKPGAPDPGADRGDQGGDAGRGTDPGGAQGEPRLPAQRQEARQEPQRDAPQLTEHQRTQAREAEHPTGERVRDPATGRFLPRDGEQPQPQQGAQLTGGDAGAGAHDAGAEGAPVPSWRLREERETREATQTALREAQQTNQRLMQMLERFQQPQQPQQQRPEVELPDPVLDPKGYHAAVMGEVTQAFRAQMLDQDLRYAHMKHGEKFEKAYEAFLAVAPQHPDFARSVVNGPTPGERMVEWYDRQTMMAEIGPDPRVWMSNQITAALQNPEFLQKAIDAAVAQQANGNAGGGQQQPQRRGGQQPASTFRLPPSLSRLPSGSPGDEVQLTGRNEDDSSHMFAFATTAKRK
jgi:hypothetical protein